MNPSDKPTVAFREDFRRCANGKPGRIYQALHENGGAGFGLLPLFLSFGLVRGDLLMRFGFYGRAGGAGDVKL